MKSAALIVVLYAFLCVGAVSSASAQDGRSYTPFMLSFVTPLQGPPRDFDVGGLRISGIYGECRDFDGLDLGFVGRATGHGNGLQSCAVNLVDGDGVGLQANWLVGFVKGEYAGFQVGTVNYAAKAQALQIGFYNGSEYIQGLQIGVINITRQMIGMQIGLVNVVQDNDVPFLPIINCSF